MPYFDSILGFRHPLLISDGAPIVSNSDCIEEWVKACIYIGWWAKSQYQVDKRRITHLVLPSRECTTAFVALGSLLWSAKNYVDGLIWGKFSCLDQGTEIYWQKTDSRELFNGKVVGIEFIANEPAIKLEITNSRRRADIGSFILIPEMQFCKYHFSLEKPASSQREISLNAGVIFLQQLIGGVSSSWAKSEGQDLLLVTKITQFKASIENLLLGLINSVDITSVKLDSLLGFEQLGGDRHSKMKISHPRGELASSAGLVLLDGSTAFSIREHISSQNDLLIIFDTSEFDENELDFTRTLEAVADPCSSVIPCLDGHERFPVGFEVSSYSFSR